MSHVLRLNFLPKEEYLQAKNLDIALSLRNSFDIAKFSLVFHIIALYNPYYTWASFRCDRIFRKIPQIFIPSVFLA